MIYGLLVADILMVGSFLWRLATLPPQIPLFYSKSWGEDRLVDLWYIFFLPLLLHLFILINQYVKKGLFAEDIIVKKIIEIANWVVIATLTGIFLKIIFFVS
ncbi:MAG: hypothetical protein Q7S61_05600 [bacterium]|nr:hypothetical protein [bacterium]